MQTILNLISFLISASFSFVLMLLMFRLLLTWFRVNTKDPVIQGMFSLTNLFVEPVKKYFPQKHRIDFATVSVILLVEMIKVLLLNLFAHHKWVPLFSWIFQTFGETLQLGLDTLFYAVVLEAIFSWVTPLRSHPVGFLLRELVEPLLKPIKDRLPPFKGMDFSPLVAAVLLKLVSWIVVSPLLAIAAS